LGDDHCKEWTVDEQPSRPYIHKEDERKDAVCGPMPCIRPCIILQLGIIKSMNVTSPKQGYLTKDIIISLRFETKIIETVASTVKVCISIPEELEPVTVFNEIYEVLKNINMPSQNKDRLLRLMFLRVFSHIKKYTMQIKRWLNLKTALETDHSMLLRSSLDAPVLKFKNRS